MQFQGIHVATIVMFLTLSGIIIVSGCTQLNAHVEDQYLALTTNREVCTPESNLPHSGSELLLQEAERQLARMNSSRYTHETSVDEENGTYDYDCSGFIGYALSRADPCAFSVLLHKRPDAGNFYYHLAQFGPEPGSGSWMRISKPLELRPGDIIVWLKPDESDSKSTGHIMVVSALPEQNLEREGEILVTVIDSTTSAHANDTRHQGQSGLGKGTIGIMTDSSGLPTGYYWRGGVSSTLQKTEMVFARIT
jgi:hypothetical protein